MGNTFKIKKHISRIGSSLGIILDKIFLDSANLEIGDKVEISIKKLDSSILSIKCPRCSESFNVKVDKPEVWCPQCSLPILNKDFQKFQTEFNENLREE